MKNLPNIFKHRDNFVNSFDKIFDQMGQKQFPTLTDELDVDFFSKTSYPKVDIIDYKDTIKIISEIPGLTKNDISVEVKDGVLTISGNKATKDEADTKGTYLYRELKHSSFKRSFTLGDSLNTDNVEAKFEDGILNVSIPKLEPKEEQIQVIDIK